MERDIITVIIPVYNVEQYIDKCLASVVNQTYRDLEILLINDGSTDSCPQICDEWAKNDNRVRVIHKENGGVSSARNVGLREATGKYISFVDPDDLLHERMYEILVKQYQNEEIDMAMCRENAFFQEEKIDFDFRPEEKVEILDKIKVVEIFHDDFPGIITWVWNKLFKSEYIKELAFREDFIASEDTVFMAEVMKYITKAAFVQDRLYYYRQQEGSVMNSGKEKIFTDQGLALILEYDILRYIEYDTFQMTHFLSCLNKIARLEAKVAAKRMDVAKDMLTEMYFELWKENTKFHLSIKEKVKAQMFIKLRNMYNFIYTGQIHVLFL